MPPEQIPEFETIPDRLVDAVASALEQGRRVRRGLPGAGRLVLDPAFPLIHLHRRDVVQPHDEAARLICMSPSYILAPGRRVAAPALASLVQAATLRLIERAGAMLLLELWIDDAPDPPLGHPAEPGEAIAAGFELLASPSAADEAEPIFQVMLDALRQVTLDAPAQVRLTRGAPVPPNIESLFAPLGGPPPGCLHVGLAVSAIYRNPETGNRYPRLFHELRRQLHTALVESAHAFLRTRTNTQVHHPLSIGPRRLDRAGRHSDRGLARLGNAFDFLLEVSPCNKPQAWQAFEASNHEREPAFQYKPLAIDPALLKRHLYNLPIDDIDDPLVAGLLERRRTEMDRQLTMLADRNTPAFLPGSVQLYGRPDAGLLDLAHQLLAILPPADTEHTPQVSAHRFLDRARAQIRAYRERDAGFHASAQLRDDVTTLLVSQGSLLIARDYHMPAHRVDALVHHEVSTHLLTYFNGQRQPLRQLGAGLAGYESLQEGLAVLAEHLVAGLDAERLRTLAARVLAVASVPDGATFLDTFRLLRHEHHFDAEQAFILTMRAHRGGGFTKDMIYLKGLADLLAHLAAGGQLDPLYVGLISLEDLPALEALRRRDMIDPAPLKPVYLSTPTARERMPQLRRGVTPLDLARDIAAG
ncbi:MAG: tyrosine/phenylalanine carboxypeptidase domain-containing protein [Phycisphaeraceae bacterium]